MDIRSSMARSLIAIIIACALPGALAAQIAGPDDKIDLKCERYLSPAVTLPTGKYYPENYIMELKAGLWRITPDISGQKDWSEAPQPAGKQYAILNHIDFKWKNGTKAVDFTYIGTMQRAFGEYFVVEIGYYDAPALTYFCFVR
jgi:hypothetical protein